MTTPANELADCRRLPLGVIIPTFNSSAYLPGHLASLDRWLDLAEEVVVVDSESTDGTMDLLRAGLRHRNLRFFTRPRGLYQAWNFGVAQLQSEFAYVSTAGDSISREGILHLVETARRLACDVVMSPPELVPEAGAPPLDYQWPVHHIIDALRLTAPARLRRSKAYFYAMIYALPDRLSGFLGSSASNLYRTAMLQARPFPDDCGHAGDVVWGVRHGLEISFAITPRCVSVFLIHAPPSKEKLRENIRLLRERVPPAVAGALTKALEQSDAPDIEEVRWLDRYFREAQSFLTERSRLNRIRREDILWFVKPSAWRTRARRNRHERQRNEAEAHLARIPAIEEPAPAVATALPCATATLSAP
jgi:glycosyltransferase involved in cell wall biosynthesis